MYVLAISKKGAEFFYKAETAHVVKEKQAEIIAQVLNNCKVAVDGTETVWALHEIDKYSTAYTFACEQAFLATRDGMKHIRGYNNVKKSFCIE